ncbi:MAG: serine/threonine protein kinase, partial [Planctomycetaceae bacterium]
MSSTVDEPGIFSRAADDGTAVQDALSLEQSRELSRKAGDPPPHVPGYEVLRCLGVGSFGSVWLAREHNTGRHVAIKFYSHRRGLDWSLLSREVEKLAVLYTSRNIVGLLDVGWNHDPPYFVMEYLENGSLAALLKEGPLPIEQAVQLAKAIAAALVHAHGSGILHCDVKPANVLLDGNFEPRLGDFGQSRLSDDQTPALGTMFYMAPEQADLQAIPDARWDVYALGALLYHMLCGHAPYRSETNEMRIRSAKTLVDQLAEYRRVIDESPRPDEHRKKPGVDRLLAEIIDRSLHPDPQERSLNAQVVLDELERRDQTRAKRPLILLGYLGPLLFLLAMSWIAKSAIPKVVEAANANLIDRQLAGDEVAAQVLAHGLESDLTNRLGELERLADDPKLREFIRTTNATPPEDWAALDSPLEEWQQTAIRRLHHEDRAPDQSWFITNAAGDQIARQPFEDNTLGKNYSWRSYFHGGVEDYPPDAAPADLAPRVTPGISPAFRSQATDRYIVALAVPVWDEARAKVIGILARTIDLPDLLSPWEERVRGKTTDEAKRFLSLVDAREGSGFLLDHQWMTREAMERMSDAEVEQKLRLPDAAARRMRESSRSDEFRDPIAEAGLDDTYSGPWLAAFAPVEETGWVAVVQEQRDE